MAVAAADLRGIGRLDIIVAEADSESIGVFLGNDAGRFRRREPFRPRDSDFTRSRRHEP